MMVILNIFVLTPISILVNYFFFYLSSCKCLGKTDDKTQTCYCCIKCIRNVGVTITFYFAFIGLVGGLLAAAQVSNPDRSFAFNINLLINYAWSTHVMSVVVDFIFIGCRFFIFDPCCCCSKNLQFRDSMYGKFPPRAPRDNNAQISVNPLQV